MNNLLREYVTRIVKGEFLNEALTPNEMAVFGIDNGDIKMGLIYNARNLKNVLVLRDKNDIQDAMNDKIIGLIAIKKPQDPCAQAWEVTNSAGPGYGKMVYALGFYLSPSGRLMPDRNSVSQDAFAGWSKQKGRQKTKLDNVREPKSSNKLAHCEVWGTEDADVVDQSYKGSNEGFPFDAMIGRHDKISEYFSQQGFDLDEMLTEALTEFWAQKYKGNVRLKRTATGVQRNA